MKRFFLLFFVFSFTIVSCSADRTFISILNRKQLCKLKKETPVYIFHEYKNYVKNYRNQILLEILQKKSYRSFYFIEYTNQIDLTYLEGCVICDSIDVYDFSVDVKRNIYKVKLCSISESECDKNKYIKYIHDSNFTNLIADIKHSSTIRDGTYVFLSRVYKNSNYVETISFYEFTENKIIYK